MSLNDTKIRNLKPPITPIKLSDSHGLYLHVKPTVRASGISDITSVAKKPASHWAHIR